MGVVAITASTMVHRLAWLLATVCPLIEAARSLSSTEWVWNETTTDDLWTMGNDTTTDDDELWNHTNVTEWNHTHVSLDATEPSTNATTVAWDTLDLQDGALHTSGVGSLNTSSVDVNVLMVENSTTNTEPRPNLLFITVDQMRWDALGIIQAMHPGYLHKAKIRTPNLDRLAASNTIFTSAYAQLPSCGPTRMTLFSGCTIERSGVQANKLVANKYAKRRPDLFTSKIDKVATFEQLLVEERGYVAENYGKWHIPNRFYYSRDGSRRIIQNNDMNIKTGDFRFVELNKWRQKYVPDFYRLAYQRKVSRPPRTGNQQIDPWTKWPYDPILLDGNWGKGGLQSTSKAHIRGWASIPFPYTSTSMLGRMAVQALRRLAAGSDPFSLVVNFSSPHAPMLPSKKNRGYYSNAIKNLFVTPSNSDPMKNTPYRYEKNFHNRPKEIREWTAVYYALIDEIDTWIGHILNELEALGLKDNTFVVFTSDHGELLGAHGQQGKGNLYEESSRVPMIMSFPGRIPAARVVKTPVSHLDVFSTVLDYLGAGELDDSDGSSLRRFIAGDNINEFYDDNFVVVETDTRYPNENGALNNELGFAPNFSIRKGSWKLIITKRAKSKNIDTLFNLKKDRYEQVNLIGKRAHKATSQEIGKAEHLKLLLIQYMKQRDGIAGYYSDPRWNDGEGEGDITEITNRRRWPRVGFWKSDETIKFGRPAKQADGTYVRYEWLYIGRTTPGQYTLEDIIIRGEYAAYFSVSRTKAVVVVNGHKRIRVKFQSNHDLGADYGNVRARLTLVTDLARPNRVVDIRGTLIN